MTAAILLMIHLNVDSFAVVLPQFVDHYVIIYLLTLSLPIIFFASSQISVSALPSYLSIVVFAPTHVEAVPHYLIYFYLPVGFNCRSSFSMRTLYHIRPYVIAH